MGTGILSAIGVSLAMQGVQGSVGGTVRDEATGSPLTAVTIELTDLNRSTATDSEGRYILRDIPAGAQHLRVRILGHAPRTLHALVPSQGHIEIHVTLRAVAFALVPIEVRAPISLRAPGLGEAGSFPDRASSMAAVRNHPQLPEPDVFQAIAGGEIVVKPESPSGVHIRGGASDHTAFVLDGIPVFSPYHTGSSFSAWNPDALAYIYSSTVLASPAQPASLSGTVAGVTRAPRERVSVQGAATTTQTRLTVDGPLGAAGAGYLISVRSGLPGMVGSKRESSHLAGTVSDWLSKVETPAFGGKARLLAYASENEISTSAVSQAEQQATFDARRNSFEWHSRSIGAEWNREFRQFNVRFLGWSAGADAESVWFSEPGRIGVAANRREKGVLATLEQRSDRATKRAGVRVERSNTSYGISADSGDASWRVTARTPVVSLFGEETRPLGDRFELKWVATVIGAGGRLRAEPRAQLRWSPSALMTVSAGYARSHQFAQSLRNAESVVGNIFPADLFMGAGASGVPVAGSDLGLLAAEYRPNAGVRIGAQVYSRAFDGLLLISPNEGEPFATRRPVSTSGSGSARGFALDATVATARIGFLGNYGYQRVRRKYGELSFTPDHGTTHLIDLGLIGLPTATSSIRLGATGAFGRRTTSVSGGFEWEACNLKDRGCEFSGSPYHNSRSLGTTALPLYLRVDIGVKKHWHFDVGARDVRLETFGTVTNIFDRKNVMTYATDPATSELVGIEMRPRAPLVLGIDWRF